MLSDLRYAFRTLAKNPGFAIIVVLILAVGIGANTAMFSVVDGILLRPLPFKDAERLYAVQEVAPKFAHLAPAFPVSYHHLREWRKDWTSAEDIAVFNTFTTNLTTPDGEPERLNGGRASWNLFPILGIQPQIGRSFTAEEDSLGHEHVVVISDDLWRRRFHADPGVLGRKILLDGAPFEVIGVLPRGLRVPKGSELVALHVDDVNPDFWRPLAIRADEIEPLGDFNFACIARLKPGISPAQALDQLNAIQASIIQRFSPEPLVLNGLLVPLQSVQHQRLR